MNGELNERKKQILRAVVDSYIERCEPVGSKFLVDYLNLGLSSATIRNIMNELEQLGLLEQPYTSAGRIPSSMGYRMYVDNLMENYHLTAWEIRQITVNINEKLNRLDKLIEKAGKIMSSLTSLMSFSMQTNYNDFDLYFNGASNLFNCPEYHNINRLREIFALMDEKETLLDILADAELNAINIFIGEETAITNNRDTSLIFKTFLLDDNFTCAIGVIGPKRMDYSKIIANLDYFSENIKKIYDM